MRRGDHSTYRVPRTRRAYRGKRVLVAGGAISALEIAVELAAARCRTRVVVTQRRQRYVLPKFAAGVPSDHRIFTRYGALASEALPPAEVDRQLKEIVVEAGGSPEQYGAPAPDPSLFAAGVTLSQHYLPLVAEGRITVRPWMTSVAGRTVTFADGSAEEFDGILFGTGFELSLPFLSDDVARSSTSTRSTSTPTGTPSIPTCPGWRSSGMWDQSGGYFVPLELQARWIAYTWGGVDRDADEADQRSAIAAYRATARHVAEDPNESGRVDFRPRRRGRAAPRRTGRSCGARCCSARWHPVVSGSRAPMRCPMRRPASRAMPPRSARSSRPH